MRRIMSMAAVAVLLMVPFNLFAESPSYSFVEAGYVDLSIDKDNIDSIDDFDEDGWFAGGSYGLKHFHVFAEYLDAGDADSWSVGAGWQGLLGEKADLVAQLSWQNVQVDTTSLGGIEDVDSDGTVASVGVRWQLIKLLEVNGFINATDFDDVKDDYTWDVNAIFTFGKLGVGAGYASSNEGTDTARLFGRWMFGR